MANFFLNFNEDRESCQSKFETFKKSNKAYEFTFKDVRISLNYSKDMIVFKRNLKAPCQVKEWASAKGINDLH